MAGKTNDNVDERPLTFIPFYLSLNKDVLGNIYSVLILAVK